jgi:hypothetical protein
MASTSARMPSSSPGLRAMHTPQATNAAVSSSSNGPSSSTASTTMMPSCVAVSRRRPNGAGPGAGIGSVPRCGGFGGPCPAAGWRGPSYDAASGALGYVGTAPLTAMSVPTGNFRAMGLAALIVTKRRSRSPLSTGGGPPPRRATLPLRLSGQPDRRPVRGVLRPHLGDHPDRTLTQFRRVVARSTSHGAIFLSRSGAPGNAGGGAVQLAETIAELNLFLRG